jgi:8-oxo-dGTP pyrophosphatase MutT (NUDIX family)
MENISAIQLKILSELLFNPKARFKSLNIDGLTSDHFSYHIKTLVEQGYIKKDGSSYSLTAKGKMLGGKIDTVNNTIEKQPKVSVFIIPVKKFGKVKKFLIQQRTKEPYYGYWGFPVGKIKFGNTIAEAANRELKEETGMYGKAKFCFEIHEMVYDKDTGNQLEDKFFQVVEVSYLEGELMDTKEGHHTFLTEKEFRKISPKYHNEDDIMTLYLKKNRKFIEEKYYIEKF